MLEFQIQLKITRVNSGDPVHSTSFKANARYTYNLLHAVEPAYARLFAKTYDLPPEDTKRD